MFNIGTNPKELFYCTLPWPGCGPLDTGLYRVTFTFTLGNGKSASASVLFYVTDIEGKTCSNSPLYPMINTAPTFTIDPTD